MISNVCGCHGFVQQVTNHQGTQNVICADFTKLPRLQSIDELKTMTRQDRDRIEQDVAAEVATELIRRLPTNDRHREALIDSGQKLVARMGWDQVIESSLLPLLEQVCSQPAQLNHGPVPV